MNIALPFPIGQFKFGGDHQWRLTAHGAILGMNVEQACRRRNKGVNAGLQFRGG